MIRTILGISSLALVCFTLTACSETSDPSVNTAGRDQPRPVPATPVQSPGSDLSTGSRGDAAPPPTPPAGGSK